jgi:hypothetical protein
MDGYCLGQGCYRHLGCFVMKQYRILRMRTSLDEDRLRSGTVRALLQPRHPLFSVNEQRELTVYPL